MRMKRLFVTLFVLLCAPQIVSAQNDTSVLHASTVLDGKGGVQHNVDITIRGGKIERIGPAQANAKNVYDLQGLTILPGLIDTHVHIAWHLGRDGRYQPRDTSQVTAMGYAME